MVIAKISDFNINLDNTFYKPGGLIKGQVNFKINQSTEINCIKVLFTGISKVHWSLEILVKNDQQNTGNASPSTSSSLNQNTQTSTSDAKTDKEEWNKKKTVDYDSTEEWFNSSLVLFNNVIGKPVEKGIHSYNFQFILPHNIPASFNHATGSIIYAVEAFIEMPKQGCEKKMISFTVSDFYDLNTDSSLKLAYGNTAKKEFCCDILNCRKEPVLANFSVDKGGFIPGQAIKFHVTIDNKSSRAIKTKTVTLYKNIKFTASGETKTDKVEIASVRLQNDVEPRSTQKWHNQLLNIPGNCKPSSQHSKIIEVSYELVLYFAAGGFTTGSQCPIPIVIGTEPFTNEIVYASNTDLEDSDSPPTYDEAMRVSPSAPAQEEKSWVNSFMFWK